MADREKKKQAAPISMTLQSDLNGNYRYRGAHYRYARMRNPARQGAEPGCGLCAAAVRRCTVAAGVAGATARAPLYLELPYMAALVRGVVRRGGTGARNARRRPDAGLRSTSRLCKNCPLCVWPLPSCAAWLLRGRGQAVLQMEDKCLAHSGVFILFEIAACAAFAAAAGMVKKMPWNREE